MQSDHPRFGLYIHASRGERNEKPTGTRVLVQKGLPHNKYYVKLERPFLHVHAAKDGEREGATDHNPWTPCQGFMVLLHSERSLRIAGWNQGSKHFLRACEDLSW